MGDYTGMTAYVRAPKELVPHIASIIESYYGHHVRTPDPEKNPDATDIYWEGGDVAVGSMDELTAQLDALMADGVEGDDEGDLGIAPTPFAYVMWEEPKYEWNGDLRIRVPLEGGHYLEYSAECDSQGTPIVGVRPVLAAVNRAADLDDAKRRIRELFGTNARAAFDAYEPPPLPQQMALGVK